MPILNDRITVGSKWSWRSEFQRETRILSEDLPYAVDLNISQGLLYFNEIKPKATKQAETVGTYTDAENVLGDILKRTIN
ncbi:hypothetical protein BCON_0228g00040 [Botryotinia convoluta]|uniref:Uncharacterized protein n=1 Tax=Botryotinia convoluta TaxID=54673 RepID=A0A4Z1HV55_9HELO|nr:hypothetical protein BCON_0228g00040 [Botryotinia convoluta]